MSRKKSSDISINAYNLINQFNNFLNENNNANIDNNKAITERDYPNISMHKNKSCLFLKKINTKENRNIYYNKALETLFYNKNNYLNNKYEGKKVIIGRKNRKNKPIKEIKEYSQNKNRRKSASISSDLKSLTVFQKILDKQKPKNILNKRKQKNFLNNNINNTTYMPVSSKREIKNYTVSDDELKLIYQNFSKLEEKNKNTNLKLFSGKKAFNTIDKINIDKILKLQEKILNIKYKRNEMNKTISDKIMNNTLKDRDDILMNQKKDLLVIKGKTLDKGLSKFNSSNSSLNEIMKNWVYSFRKNRNEEKQNTMYSPEEFIYNNKNNEDDLFQNKSNSNNIRKLILQKNKINYIKNNINESNNSNLSSFPNLCIQGKNLLKYESNLSKELLRKKKKIYRYYFTPNEVSSMLLAKSSSAEKDLSAKAVINSMEVHKLT